MCAALYVDQTEFAKEHGFKGTQLQPWDVPYWSEQVRKTRYNLQSDVRPCPFVSICLSVLYRGLSM